MKITEELLKQRGYTRFDNWNQYFGSFSWQSELYSDFIYQRRVMDEWGTKYFINLLHYPPSVHLRRKESWAAAMITIEPYYTFQMHGVSDLDEVEEKMETFWRALDCQYL